jgi:hypothetical protein
MDKKSTEYQQKTGFIWLDRELLPPCSARCLGSISRRWVQSMCGCHTECTSSAIHQHVRAIPSEHLSSPSTFCRYFIIENKCFFSPHCFMLWSCHMSLIWSGGRCLSHVFVWVFYFIRECRWCSLASESDHPPDKIEAGTAGYAPKHSFMNWQSPDTGTAEKMIWLDC